MRLEVTIQMKYEYDNGKLRFQVLHVLLHVERFLLLICPNVATISNSRHFIARLALADITELITLV